MKNLKFLSLLVFPFLLVSCAKTDELYPGNVYDTGVFLTNYYLEHNDVDQIKINETFNFDASSSTHIDNPGYGGRINGITVEDQTFVKDGDSVLLEWNNDVPVEGYGVGFGPTMNLTTIDNSFAYGFLSRLYDGRVRCDGLYAKSRVQLNKTGYGTYFPKELTNASYFAMAIRGETDCEGYEYTSAIVNLRLSLYRHISNSKECDLVSFSINNVSMPTNTHGISSLLTFYFPEVMGETYQQYLEGVVGMSLDFELVNLPPKVATDPENYGVPVDDMSDTENPHFALMLYEVMLPKSSWR